MIQKKQKEHVEFQHKYGQGKEIISTKWQGKRVVAVGSTVHLSPIDETKTFHDFLSKYIRTEFGSDWGNEELKKPLSERHIVMQWYSSTRNLQKNKGVPSADGIYSAVMDGPTAAYYNLAYQLYLIRHNSKLKDEFLRRLRDPLQFQGARYELFVAATFVRAGFEIQFEDESDGSSRHPEFIATHLDTKQKIAVEAKSRHRSGQLGQPGPPPLKEKIKARVGTLLNDAFDKNPSVPYIIFLDVNFPPEEKPDHQMRKWMIEVESSQALKREVDEKDPFNMIIFTNQPHHYGAESEPDPPIEAFCWLAKNPKIQIIRPDLLHSVWTAVGLYGKIPKDFPKE